MQFSKHVPPDCWIYYSLPPALPLFFPSFFSTSIKNCSLFYFMAMIPSMKLQIRAFSWQQSSTSALQTDLFSCSHLCRFMSFYFSVSIYSLYLFFLCRIYSNRDQTHVHCAYIFLSQFNVPGGVCGSFQYT